MKIKLILFSILVSTICRAQDEETDFHRELRGSILMTNTHATGTVGKDKFIIIPTWGIDLNYLFHPRWSAALQSDIKLQSFEVKEGESVLERSYPLALAIALQYHTAKHLSFYAGPGYEIEEHENLSLIKLGSEYGFEVNKTFEIALSLAFEHKKNVYNSWVFGIAFTKQLWIEQ